MRPFFKLLMTTLSLFAVGLLLQSCNEQEIQFEKQLVQFSISPTSTDSPGVSMMDLPENARAIISVAGSNGTSIWSDHEIALVKHGNVYITDPAEFTTGSYTVTDFMIVTDSLDLYLTPKKGAESTRSDADALPYHFSITESDLATVSMRVIDVRNLDVGKFGYACSKAKANTFSVAAFDKKAGSDKMINATAEVYQNKKLLQVFSLAAATNTITLKGDSKIPYTITVYTATSAKSQTFNIKQLKKEIGKNPLRMVLDPALILTIESYVEVGNENDEYFEFRMEGVGAVNVNWGDGEQSSENLPFEVSHEYFSGNYKAIITGDIDKVTDFSGFSYSTIMPAISGLTNLTSLKVYNPSWGAVPIKVDLSNCKQLETIYIAKYGAPYEPADLRTDFKLPSEHYINSFILDVTSFDSNREFISAEELEVMADNIYTNAVNRNIDNGKFFVNPVVTPSPETQQKLDILTNEYNWTVGFNDDIYDMYDSEVARGSATDPDERREQWLRERFSKSQKIIERAHSVSLKE